MYHVANRYQSAAEAFVALGGRAGFVLSNAAFHKSLRELSSKTRQAKPAVILDVHGIMSDVERDFEGGFTFSQACVFSHACFTPMQSLCIMLETFCTSSAPQIHMVLKKKRMCGYSLFNAWAGTKAKREKTRMLPLLARISGQCLQAFSTIDKAMA